MGRQADKKRTRVRLGRRVEPTFLFAPTQTDARGRNRSPHWSFFVIGAYKYTNLRALIHRKRVSPTLYYKATNIREY